ncbi:MAG: ubiquinol-cytochrome C chaperone [Alphaproteobacteria bacterium]|nr:ubiquinol-cytochrome C chaperone [Alphaproteobacteria bacterium SS10]
MRKLLNLGVNPRPLYAALVEQSRQPIFYTDFGVPDTVWGRLDLLYLHAFLAINALPESDGESKRFIDTFFHHMFKTDLDRNLREMGVSDLAVGRKVKKMAENYHGRVTAYQSALQAGDDQTLALALAKNIQGQQGEGVSPAATALAAYTVAANKALEAVDAKRIKAGDIGWPDATALAPTEDAVANAADDVLPAAE